MRWASLAALVILLGPSVAALPAFSLPRIGTAAASDQSAPTSVPVLPGEDHQVVITDGPDDVMYAPAPKVAPQQNATQFGDRYQHLDLLRVVVGRETESDFRVDLVVKRLERADSTTDPFPYERVVMFTVGRLQWFVSDRACYDNRQSTTTGCLYHFEPGLGFPLGTPLQRDALPSEVGYELTIPKKSLFNDARVPVQFWDTLENISANAVEAQFSTDWFGGLFFLGDPTGGAYFYDHAPQDGSVRSYQFTKGGSVSDDLFLTCPSPIRASNGEATTFVYPVTIHNIGSQDARVQLVAKDVWEDWSVRAPAIVKVPAGGTTSIPVIGGIPFTHIHGATRTFNLTAARVGSNAAPAHLPLGVLWTQIPQPSAHHQGKLFLHSKPAVDNNPPWSTLFPNGATWMNGAEHDSDATEIPAPAPNNYALLGAPFAIMNSPTNPPKSTADWAFPLSPGLLIGLDFDLKKQVETSFALTPKESATATVTASVKYCDPTGGDSHTQDCSGRFGEYGAQWQSIAKGTWNGSVSGDAAVPFTIPLKVDPKFDLVKFRQGANIMFTVHMETDVPQNVFSPAPVAPTLQVEGATITLPLIEYHDQLEAAFARVGSIALALDGLKEKATNPGKTALFSFALKSDSLKRERLLLDVYGTNRNWSQIIGPDTFALGAGEKREVQVAVHTPETAGANERAALVLVAQNVDDPEVVASADFLTSLVTDHLVPDEKPLITRMGPDATPAPGVLAVLAAVAVVGFALRRKLE